MEVMHNRPGYRSWTISTGEHNELPCVALGVGDLGEYPTSYLCMCPHTALQLAAELIDKAHQVIEDPDIPDCPADHPVGL
jgi:hypothetical protein